MSNIDAVIKLIKNTPQEINTKSSKSRKKIITITPKSEGIRIRKVKEVDKHRHNLITILQSTNATAIRSKGSAGFKCAFCEKQYPEAGNLKDHTISAHRDSIVKYMKNANLTTFLVKMDISFLRCVLCDSRLESLEILYPHLINTHNKKFYTDIKNQIVPYKFESDELTCAVCQSRFNNFKVLMEHMNSHYSFYACAICGAGFVNKTKLQKHSARHGSGDFKCDYCPKVFNAKVKKKEHERATHICFNKRSKCSFCGDKFSDYAKKNDHEIEMHGVKVNPLKCHACEKSFQNQRALSRHTKYFHLLERRSFSKNDKTVQI